jgi:hypothetical protein
MSEHPKVFISHASEDKERFVVGFATRLREKGIDAWLDQWEILPGDSLVEKIFEEGIGNAQAVIIVLSEFSVEKPWVRQELSASIVRKVNKQIRLVPVVIGPCPIPYSLQDSLYVRVQDLYNYDKELQRLVMAIYGIREKPALGTVHLPVGLVFGDTPALPSIAGEVFKLIGDETLKQMEGKGSWWLVGPDRIGPEIISERAQSCGIATTELDRVLTILTRGEYIRTWQYGPDVDLYADDYSLGGLTNKDLALYEALNDPDLSDEAMDKLLDDSKDTKIVGSIEMLPKGVEEYAKSSVTDFWEMLQAILSYVGDRSVRAPSLAEALNQPQVVIELLLNVLYRNSLITSRWSSEGEFVEIRGQSY